jgi:hypothetical protein
MKKNLLEEEIKRFHQVLGNNNSEINLSESKIEKTFLFYKTIFFCIFYKFNIFI